MRIPSRHRNLVGASVVVCLALALSGCSSLGSLMSGRSADATRDAETGTVTEEASIDIFLVRVGDCMRANPGGMLEKADVVPCDQPHEEEVYHEITMPDGEFDEAAVGLASQECIGAAFSDFVGLGYQDSALEVYPITPTKETWEELDDRVIHCVISDPAGQTKGSLTGAAR